MTNEASSDAAYEAAVQRDRPLLLGLGYLLSGDRVRAEQIVQWTLTRAYETKAFGRTALIQLLLDALRRGVRPTGDQARIDLVDSAPVAPGSSIIADLRALPPTERTVLVLERYVELPTVQIAAVTGLPYESVLSAARRAQVALVERLPARSPDGVIAAELRAAVPDDLRAGSPAEDLDRARRTRTRHQLQRLLAVAAALVVTVLITVQVIPERSVPSANAPLPASTPTSGPTPSACPANNSGCRTEQLAQAWAVISGHLDQTDYFTHTSLVTGRDSVVTLRMSRPGGATEVIVEFAPDRRTARRCGRATGHRCVSQRFMDGNRFILTTSLTAREGIEVQYRPEGTEVMTAIARDIGSGDRLEISTSDLINLLQDPQLLER